MTNASDAITTAITDVVHDRFPDINIERVDVEEGVDHDGDMALYVRIVFQADVEDVRKSTNLVGLTRYIRSRLTGMKDERFPYTQFISSSDFHGAVA